MLASLTVFALRSTKHSNLQVAIIEDSALVILHHSLACRVSTTGLP